MQKKSIQIVFFVTIAALIGVNVLLVFQNLELKSRLEGAKLPEIKVGDFFNELNVKDLNDNERKINFADGKRILYFFRTTCGYCKKQMGYWKNLAALNKYRLTAITTETDTQAVKNYLREYEVENWDVVTTSPEQAQKFKLLVTPITIVVNNDGIVEKVWTGLWQPADIDTVSQYFETVLPKEQN